MGGIIVAFIFLASVLIALFLCLVFNVRIERIPLYLALSIMLSIGIFGGFIFLYPLVYVSDVDIQLPDGKGKTYCLWSHYSRVYVNISSSLDPMHVEIIIDGETVLNETSTYHVKFERYLGFGYHRLTINIINPKSQGTGVPIVVKGVIRIYRF
mgnify:CR=1 FL=1